MSTLQRTYWRWIAHIVSVVCALCWCRPAAACGGFFCSRTPIDQTAERIIFAVNDDGTITAYVQIQYAGERDAFAWVVPVPSVPVLDTFPRLAFQALDLATEPAYRTYCGQRLLAQGGSQRASGGVIVYNQQAVGPFQTVTIGGDSADDLVAWLQDNGYRISNAMLPFINDYVRDHMLFLAMKLLPDANVSDIEPVAMTYIGTEPMIPLRLTAVAAKPELGVLAFILADRRYGPSNYADVTIADDLIRFDESNGRNNYLALVSREIDRHGGHAFVTEYAHASVDLVTQFQNAFVPQGNDDARKANDRLIALLQRHPYITRLYTRISPEEMTVDPVFVPASSQVDVTNIHDSVADNPCGPATACSFSYCGTQGMCLPVDSRTDGCYCNLGATAMITPTFGPQPAVYCEPVATDVLGAPDAGPGANLCSSVDCGEGTCRLINGNPTCQCTPGHVAVAMISSSGSSPAVRCVSQSHQSINPGVFAADAGVHNDAGSAGVGGTGIAGGSHPGTGSGGARASEETRATEIAQLRGAGCDCTVGGAEFPRTVGWPTLGLLVAIGLRRRARFQCWR